MDGKRHFDLVFGLGLLLIFLPILITVAILVRWLLGSPVLFVHERPGLNGRPFRLFKFRTMTSERGPDGNCCPTTSDCRNLVVGSVAPASTNCRSYGTSSEAT